MSRMAIKSLRTRLVMLILLAVIPALIYIFYNSYEDRKHLETEINRDALSTARLAAELGKVKIPQKDEAVLSVTDRTHTILYRNPDFQKRAGTKVSEREFPPEPGTLREHVAVSQGFDGKERIWAFALVPGMDSSIIVRYGISRTSALAQIDSELFGNLIILLLITLIALGVAWFGGDYFVLRRIKLLQAASAELKRGNLEARVDVAVHDDEIGRLGRDFNEMAAALDRQNRMRRISEEKYRTLFEESKDTVFVVSPEGRYVDINAAGVEMFGYSSREEMLRLDINKDIYFDPEDRRVYKQQLEEKGDVKDYEVRLKRKDGGILNVLVSAILVRDEKGNVLEYRGLNHDITERRRAEEELKKTKNLLESVFNSTQDLIVVIDRNRKILMSNWKSPVYADGAVLPVDAHCYEAFVRRGEPCEKCHAMDVFNTGRSAIAEFYNEHTGLFKEVTSYPIFDDNGQVIMVVEHVRDITERKKAEDEKEKLEAKLLHAQKMEAIGQLAGGVAHDFNNILQAIFANLYILKNRQKGSGVEAEEVGEIYALSNRAVALTQSLLSFSRKQPSNLQPMDLNSAILEIEKILARTIGEDIHLSLELTGENTTVYADSNQLDQILINLAANSRDAMSKGGRLTISTEQVFLDEVFIRMHGYGRKGHYVLMTVTDTGVGMDEATLVRAFEPFFTTKEVGKGTGLGLSMAYGIIKQHDGFIDVHSEVEKGTVVMVYLPALEERAGEKENVGHFMPESATETVLLVEDDSSLRDAMTRMLQGVGYTVIEARDGDDAIAKFSERKDEIQLVLMDVIMPNRSGGDAYQKLRAIQPDVKIILMSGYAGDFLLGKLSMEEDVHFLTKPISPKELFEKIRSVLKGLNVE